MRPAESKRNILSESTKVSKHAPHASRRVKKKYPLRVKQSK